MQNIFLSVIIPAYNEALRISHTIIAIDEYLKTKPWKWEILVINDGSSDETKDVVERFQNCIPCLKLISYHANKGKGYAVRTGMLEAVGRYRLFLDADYSVTINNWDKFSRYLKEYDVIIGSIEKQGAYAEENGAWYRRILGKLSKVCVRAVILPGILDCSRGFKIFSAQAAEDIFSRQIIDSWVFDIETLVIAQALGYGIKELPVVWKNPAGSKVTLHSYWDSLLDLRIIKKNLAAGRYLRI